MTGVAAAIATNEVNASLGLIYATLQQVQQGFTWMRSCIKQKFNIDEETQLRMLFTAGAFGFVCSQ